MSEAPAFREACADRIGSSQACLVPQGPNVGHCRCTFTSLHRLIQHRLEIFDEYTRRQYVAKAPERNPFGTDEVPNKFNDFDVFTKIRVLQQLSAWTFYNPNHIREKMGVSEAEQALWVSDARVYRSSRTDLCD